MKKPDLNSRLGFFISMFLSLFTVFIYYFQRTDRISPYTLDKLQHRFVVD